MQPYQTELIGQRVTHIDTRGKALLTRFSGGLTLYSHNQLYGVWRVVEAGEQPASNRVLRVRLQTTSKAILLYSASDIEMLTAVQEANHPFLLRVGPDVLDMTLTAEQVKARLLSAKFRNRQFSGLLLDQAFLAGLGNYLRVEILWQVGLTGGIRPRSLMKHSWMRWRTRYSISRGFLIALAASPITTSTTARCSALRSSIAMGKSASAAGA